MIRFECDYHEGAHPKVLERLVQTNFEQTSGYGCDDHCRRAVELTKELCAAPDADVHFLVGGTQTNRTVITSALRPHQGVIAAATGHIAVHETGAIEASGHKVLTIDSPSGLLDPAEVEAMAKEHFECPIREHSVQPGMVYISHPAENGALYSFERLEALRKVCDRYGLYLFLDGARMGYGLTSEKSELTLPQIASLCDVFYIGGTKCGALFGEAVVITNDDLKRDFRYHIKQNGGLLAKGRLLGIQFEILFEDGLYFDICRSANEKALRIKNAFLENGYKLFADSHTNQQFVVFNKAQFEYFSKEFAFEEWGVVDCDHTAYRFCTSWATSEEAVDKLCSAIASCAESLM